MPAADRLSFRHAWTRHIPARWRVRWRDAAGNARTTKLATERAAQAFVAELPARGTFVRMHPEAARWTVNWYDDGRVLRTLVYRTKTAAQRACQLKEQELNTWLRPPQQMTWPTAIAGYAAHMQAAGLSSKHLSNAALVLHRFWTLLQPTHMHQITPAAADVYFIGRRRGEPAEPRHGRKITTPDGRRVAAPPEKVVPSAHTLRRERAILRAFCEWAVRQGALPENPIAKTPAPRTPKRKRRPPNPNQWVALLEAAAQPRTQLDDPQAWHLLILLAAVTGLRQGVLLKLRLTEIELGTAATADVGLLHVFSPKTAKEELRALPPEVSSRVAQRIAALPDGAQRLFPWPIWPRKAWERIQRVSGHAIRFHALRGAAGTQAAVQRARQAGAQKLAHSSVAVFRDHYADEEAIERAAALTLDLPILPPLPPYQPRTIPRGPSSRTTSAARPSPPADPAQPAASAATSAR